MAIIKTKFAGFLRGLFGRGDRAPEDRPAAASAPAAAPPPAYRPPHSTPPASAPAEKSGRPIPTGGQAPSAPAAAANDIEMPLTHVLASLPMELRAKLMPTPPPNITIRLQAEKVISQLAFGAVKISFGELRRLAPGVFVNSSGELDNKMVNLPLQEILQRLNPALLARRAARKVELAEEIVGPFAERGRGFSFTTQPLKGAPAAAPAPAPAPEPPAALVPPMAVRPSPLPPIEPPIPQRSVTPAAPIAPITPPTPAGTGLVEGPGPLPISPLSPRSSTPTTLGTIGSAGHGSNGHGGNGNGHSLPPTAGLRTGPLPGNSQTSIPSPLRISPVTPGPADLPPATGIEATIRVAIDKLCENWPEVLRDEIFSSPLAQAHVALPSSLVLPGLRRGRIVMPWRQLRLLAHPGSAPSPNDHLELELPLKVIAPLFVATQKNSQRPQARLAASTEIPDLFFGFPQPPAISPAPVAPPMPAAYAAPDTSLVPPLPKAPEPMAQETNYYTLADKAGTTATEESTAARGARVPQTEFATRLAHPKEVVARAAALSGVAGAIVAMQDGLSVASQVPAEFNSDTLAAFLPQIFERVNQCTRELRMGTLNNVNFTVGNIPWKIFRVNAVYFAAFGRAGEPFPTGPLAQLAAELDRKKA